MLVVVIMILIIFFFVVMILVTVVIILNIQYWVVNGYEQQGVAWQMVVSAK